MRRIVLGMAATLLAIAPTAKASEIEIVHEATVPCAIACGYGLSEAGFDPCSNPSPAASYDQTHFAFDTQQPHPRFADMVASSELDYDTFICTDTDPPVYVDVVHCSTRRWQCVPTTCTGPVPGVSIGCDESLRVTQAQVLAASDLATSDFIVRSFNWLDRGVVTIAIDGAVFVTDDSFCGAPVETLCRY